jgi:hypothetical protein
MSYRLNDTAVGSSAFLSFMTRNFPLLPYSSFGFNIFGLHIVYQKLQNTSTDYIN